MEINSDSLFVGVLSICMLPLFLLSLVMFAVWVTRLRIREGKQMRKKLNDGAYNYLIENKKILLLIRVMAIISLIVIIVMLIGFLFMVSRPLMLMPSGGNGRWMYVLMIGLPLACSAPASIFALLYAYRMNK